MPEFLVEAGDLQHPSECEGCCKNMPEFLVEAGDLQHPSHSVPADILHSTATGPLEEAESGECLYM